MSKTILLLEGGQMVPQSRFSRGRRFIAICKGGIWTPVKRLENLGDMKKMQNHQIQDIYLKFLSDNRWLMINNQFLREHHRIVKMSARNGWHPDWFNCFRLYQYKKTKLVLRYIVARHNSKRVYTDGLLPAHKTPAEITEEQIIAVKPDGHWTWRKPAEGSTGQDNYQAARERMTSKEWTVKHEFTVDKGYYLGRPMVFLDDRFCDALGAANEYRIVTAERPL